MKSPDGICLDREGAVWVAAFDEDAFIRLNRDGRELQRIEVPGRRAIACALGGPERRTLVLPERGDVIRGTAAGQIIGLHRRGRRRDSRRGLPVSGRPDFDASKVLAPTGRLRVGAFAGSPLSMARDAATGEIHGLSIDLGKEFAKRLGVPFEQAGLSANCARCSPQ